MPNVSIVAVISIIFWWSSVPAWTNVRPSHLSPPAMCSGVKITLLRRRNQIAMSSSPNPTTTSPMTAPLRNAICSPLLSETDAPWAVLEEAFVAVFIPRYPHRPEKKPPVRNAIGTNGF